jgi:hypothetical protein
MAACATVSTLAPVAAVMNYTAANSLVEDIASRSALAAFAAAAEI